jgi:hypothetical protein
MQFAEFKRRISFYLILKELLREILKNIEESKLMKSTIKFLHNISRIVFTFLEVMTEEFYKYERRSEND